MQLDARQLEHFTGGRLRGGAPDVSVIGQLGRVRIDSRTLEPGDVFWALPGRRHDGAEFVEDAFGRGARGVVTSRRDVQPPQGHWALIVDNPTKALKKLAAQRRARFDRPVVAVTGSVGKTTTRAMIQQVLETSGPVCATRGNMNNHLGLPLSMLALGPQHNAAVFELGASAAGEIADLAELCQPHLGVITAIGEAHAEGFGGWEQTLVSKAELLAELPEDGVAILNGDDPHLKKLAAASPVDVLLCGRESGNHLTASDVSWSNGCLRFTVGRQKFQLPLWGRHFLSAALLAIAVGRHYEHPLSEMADSLAEFRPLPQRCHVQQLAGVTIIDDTYNASPQSMTAALELLQESPGHGRRIAVLGSMLELGQLADSRHEQLGREAVTRCSVDLLLCYGPHAEQIVTAAKDAGFPAHQAIAANTQEELCESLIGRLACGDTLLVKASRAQQAERVTAFLRRHLSEQRELNPADPDSGNLEMMTT